MRKHPVWRGIKIALGSILVPLGIVGLFLPLLQGVLFLLVGLALLASEIPAVARVRDRIRRRYPGPWDKAEEISHRIKARFGIGGENR